MKTERATEKMKYLGGKEEMNMYEEAKKIVIETVEKRVLTG